MAESGTRSTTTTAHSGSLEPVLAIQGHTQCGRRRRARSPPPRGSTTNAYRVSGGDEIAKLESNFNRMPARLSDAMVAERHVASAGKLHDSISQDLFSLRLLAGGLRRALPPASPLHPQVQAMERTMHEQASLLELRSVALRDAGLIPALSELCQAYRDRLGVTINAALEPVELDPAVEDAVLRVVQEALANAVKHARPTRITMRVHSADHQVAGRSPTTATASTP